MAITRPTTKTVISTTAWGWPVTDAVNANTADLAALKPGAWIQATMQNGWTHFAGQPISYRKVGDVVSIRGRASGSATWVAIFTLPVGYRPPYDVIFAVGGVNSSWFTTTVQVAATGIVNSMATLTDIAPVLSFSITP